MSRCNITITMEADDLEVHITKTTTYPNGKKTEWLEYVLDEKQKSITLGLDSSRESIAIGRRK